MAVIYAVECIANDYVYVGCTTSTLNRRLNEHRSYLRRRIHTSAKMQEDCDKYGTSAFKLRVLEKLPDGASRDVKREAELRWMGHFSRQGRLYNAYLISFDMAPEVRERGRTPEADLKRSQAQIGKPKRLGQGAKISATKKALGQKPTLEVARLGGIAACKVRWGKPDEIV
jgi:predicted GIY-YIG superfamily endonuclease